MPSGSSTSSRSSTRVRSASFAMGTRGEIPASDVVLDDCILLRAGDTVVADGDVIEAHFLELDEALLTGESDPVRRQVGDRVLSGSTCVAGEGCYRAVKVGNQAFAQSVSSGARRYSYTSSPMTRVLNAIITILSVAALVLCVLYFALYYFELVSTDRFVLMIAATITSMIPQGLVLTATVSFTIGAVVMRRRGALVQRLNAVEAMAAIDVICTDKTGTLTTNRLRLDRLRSLADGPDRGRGPPPLAPVRVGVARPAEQERPGIAGCSRRGGVEVLDQIPFKSQNRFSAVRLRDGGVERVLVLGALRSHRPESRSRGMTDLHSTPASGLRRADVRRDAADRGQSCRLRARHAVRVRSGRSR